MAANTYVALRTETVAVATSSVTISLTGISGYTDLVLVANYSKSAGARLNLTYNGDTGNNYSYTRMNGNGTAASSDRIANFGIIDAGYTDTTRATSVIQIMNYSNTTTFKTTLVRANSTAEGTGAFSALWRNTAAITSITLGGLNNIQAGSTFSLYGIAAEGVAPVAKATGGIITSDSTYYYHTFLSTGVFTPSTSLTCDYLVIAGGGAGGPARSGGGGAGGLLSTVTATGGGGTLQTALSLSAANYTITVGAGATANGGAVVSGNNSSIAGSGITTVTAVGGGGGGNSGFGGAPSGAGAAGGSGGGGLNGPTAGGAPTTNQGYRGGNGLGSSLAGAGGGGANAQGVDVVSGNNGTAGGAGLALSAWATPSGTGISSFYAGGGGGGYFSDGGTTGGAGGVGGGGTGGISPAAGAGVANTGGGGGSGRGNPGGIGDTNGSNGGSGLVVVRYLKA
jgi:hypothetical protein